MRDKMFDSSSTNELAKLLKQGVLGNYNCLEVTEVFAITHKGASPINLYTILVAEERKEPTFNTPSYIGDRKELKLPTLQGWFIGIKRYLLPIEQAESVVEGVLTSRCWDSCGDSVPTEEYSYSPATFVTADSFEAIPFNSIIKNNFNSGSYLIELKNESKDALIPLVSNPVLIQTLSEKIQKFIPIKIATLSDKLGNIIIQIPVTSIQGNVQGLQGSEDIKVSLFWHDNIAPRALTIVAEQKGRDQTIDSYFIDNKNEKSSESIIPFKHATPHKVTVWDSEYNVILLATHWSSFIRSTMFDMRIASNYPRVIPQKDSIKPIEIPVHTTNKNLVGEKTKKSKWLDRRLYQAEQKELLRRKEFVQYNPKGINKLQEQHRALQDIRFLINSYGSEGVWLWDPYLDEWDIINTLFFNQCSNAPMRAISSVKESSDSPKCPICSTDVCTQKKEQQSKSKVMHQFFNELPKETISGINLQVRTPYAEFGWRFHDRFIIFPNHEHGPVAWSLGTSVNSLGKEHHILQKVSDGQMIADAFEELWLSLEAEECFIWSNTDKL